MLNVRTIRSGKYLKLIGSTAKWGDHKSLMPRPPYVCFQQADNEFFYDIQIFSTLKTSTCLCQSLSFSQINLRGSNDGTVQ
jgi:hypothetical protein